MIPLDIASTCLKHLNVRRHNFYRSIEEHPDDPQVDHWNTEIDKINDAIRFLEDVRDQARREMT